MATNKFVVYTVLTGSYQTGLSNPFPDGCKGFERICFTDNMSIDAAGWTLVPLQGRHSDFVRESRRPKLMPHRYLPEFEWSLYIDNAVKLKQDPLELLESLLAQKNNFFCFRHPWRDCVYDEAEALIQMGYDDERRIREQMDHYRRLGHPKNAGLIAGGILFRKHNDPDVIQLGESWFEHVLRYSRRDQLSFNFWARMLNISYGTLDGTLTENDFMTWPWHERIDVPGKFNEDVYTWKNPEVSQSGLSPRQHYLSIGAEKKLICCKKVWELDRLANKYKTDKGSIYYNANAYAAIYQHYFEPIKNRPLRVLEMGLLRHDVQARNPGGPYDDTPSLLMWREYFPNARIQGFDIADFSTAPAIPNCEIIRGDMGNPDDLLSLVKHNEGQEFDIIIDDGSHASHHQQIALGTLFPHLKDGGYYAIEDLNYQPPQLERENARKTKELLLAIKWGKPVTSDFLTKDQLEYLSKNIDRIEFHDGFDRNFGKIGQDALVVIRKRGGSANQRRVAGKQDPNSRGWKSTAFYRILRRIFVPYNSRRAHFLKKLLGR